MAVLGNGTDTGNSIRMPAATSALVGVFPTRGLVSTAGIAPLDWLLDNTGPIARTVTDAAIALAVMTGEDPLDSATLGAPATAQRPPYESRLAAGSLKGKRFGVPAFILAGDGIPFHGIPSTVPDAAAEQFRVGANMPLRDETRAMFMKAVDALRAAGAEVVLGDSILPTSFARAASRVATYAYMKDGTDRFLATFGADQYHSAEEYLKFVGKPLFTSSIGTEDFFNNIGGVRIRQRQLATDPDAERMYHGPRRAVLNEYVATLDRLKLDGFVYPAIQMPPPDETMPQDGRLSEGPHSATSWVNMIGVPAVVVPAGFYRERASVRAGVLGPPVDGRRLVRHRPRVGAGRELAEAAGAGGAGSAVDHDRPRRRAAAVALITRADARHTPSSSIAVPVENL